MVFKDKNFLKQ